VHHEGTTLEHRGADRFEVAFVIGADVVAGASESERATLYGRVLRVDDGVEHGFLVLILE
jgi:hypothetical protein